MEEKRLIRKSLIQYMVFIFIIFTVIFSVLGYIIYGLLRDSIFKSADDQLLSSQNKNGVLQRQDTVGTDEGVDQEVTAQDKVTLEQTFSFPFDSVNSFNIMNAELIEINPRIMYLYRLENGDLISTNSIYEKEAYVDSIHFDKENLNSIYTMLLVNKYQYRGINYELINLDGTITYVQMLVNVDAEIAIIDNATKILMFAIGICILLSALASYFLSKLTLKPIIAAWRRQTEFVQNASHELKTPLAIIQTAQEMVLAHPQDKIIDQFDSISTSLKECGRLNKLMDDLMLLAMADYDKMKIQKESVMLKNIIEEITSPYLEYASMQKKQIQLHLKDTKPVVVDVDKIHELLVIIIDNSMKYTNAGDTISIHTYEKDSKCILEIKDTGIGIEPSDMNHLFERFYRSDKSHSKKTGGSGLGLSIAKAIVQGHGGSIKIEHNLPKGVIVKIKLPRHSA